MSKVWKIIIGVVVAAVIVVGGAGWFIMSRGLTPAAFARPALGRDFAPDHIRRFGQKGDVQVRLIDDNEDGIPDRGVIEEFPAGDFGRQARPGRGEGFGRGFDGGGRGVPFRRGFIPFLIVGWLFRLAVPALLIGLGIFIGRRWPSSPPPAPAPAGDPAATPIEPEIPPASTPGSAEPEEK